MNRILLLGAAFAATSFVVGCSTTGEVGGDLETPLPGGGSLNATFRVGFGGQTTADLEATEPVCIEVCFSDATGADLDCVTIEVPGSAQVPAGAVRFEATIVDCPQDGDTDGGGMADLLAGPQQPSQAVPLPYPLTKFKLIGGNIFPSADGSANVSYSFVVRTTDLAAAKARRDTVLAGGIGTNVGGGFNVIYYNESEAEFDAGGVPTGVRMRQAEVNDDFASYRLTVNGAVFAELGVTGNLSHYSAGNGWDVVETFVPTSAFDTTPGSYDNSCTADWTTVNTSIAWYAMQRVFAD